MNRVATGVHGLDELIGGGFPALRSVLLRGDSGAGKTTFALHFLMEGVRRGEAVAMVLADATRPPINHRLTIALRASPLFTELGGRRGADAHLVASDLARQVRHLNVKRLVIDDADALIASGVPPEGVEDFLRSLIVALEDNLGCTILLTVRTVDGDTSPAGAIAERLASGVIEIWGRQANRRLQVRKMRGAPTELEPYFVGGLSAPRNLSASDPNPSACAPLSRAV